MGDGDMHVQTLFAYQSSASSDIRTAIVQAGTLNIINPSALLGDLEAFATVGLSLGYDWGDWSAELFASNLFDERGQLSRYQQCGSCSQRGYIVPVQPRLIGVRIGYDF